MNQPPPLPAAVPPVWPKVLGIIGIIFGIFGILSTIASMLISPELIAKFVAEDQQKNITAQLQKTPLLVTLTVIGGVLAVLMLFGSILLLKRKASSRPLLNVYAVLSIILAVVTPIFMMERQFGLSQESENQSIQQVAEGANDQSSEERQQAARAVREAETKANIQKFSSIFSGVCTGSLSLIWPIILLIFLNRASGRAVIGSWKN